MALLRPLLRLLVGETRTSGGATTGKVLTMAEFTARLKAENERRLRENPRPPLPPQKHARVSIFRQFIHVESVVHVGALLSDPDGYADYLAPDADDRALGAATRAALNASRMIGPKDPLADEIAATNLERFDALEAEMMARAGVKTFRTFYRDWGIVSVQLIDGQITLVARKPISRGGWNGLRGREGTTLPEAASDAELGAAVRAELAISRAARQVPEGAPGLAVHYNRPKRGTPGRRDVIRKD